MHRRELLSIMAGLVAMNWSGCSSRKTESSDILRVATSPFYSASSLYLAQELGYFAEAGAPVMIERIANSTHMLPLLAGGKLDIALFSLSNSLVNAIEKGAEIRIVAGRGIISPTCGGMAGTYVSRKAFPQGLNDMRQLKGMRVSRGRPTLTMDYCLDLLLEDAGMSQDDLQIFELPRAEGVTALISGRIDAMMSGHFEQYPSSIASQMVAGPHLAQFYPNLQYSHILFGKRLLRGDLDLGVRFLSAYFRGARAFLDGKTPSNLEEFALSYHLDPELALTACRETFSPDGEIQMDDIQRFINWAVRKGYCPRRLDAAEMVDRRFLKQLEMSQMQEER